MAALKHRAQPAPEADTGPDAPATCAGSKLEKAAQAAWVHVEQVQFAHVQFAHASAQCSHSQRAWLQVGHVQSAQSQTAQTSLQLSHEHALHSS